MIQSILLENLLINTENPRYDPRRNQREAIAIIAHDQGTKLVNLAEDIVDKGLSPADLPIVTSLNGGNVFIVLEGNRRIVALKLITSPSLAISVGLPGNLAKRYKLLHDEAKNILPRKINCAVLSREDASHWILIRHTGENQGIGVVPWDGLQTQRFRGSSPALQAVELVRLSSYLDDATRKKLPKIAITNIERILGTPDARKRLGVDVKNGQLILKTPEEKIVARLAIIVSDVVNRQVKVSDLDTRDQRIEYAEEVASRPLPKPITGVSATGKSGKSAATDLGEGLSAIAKRIMLARRTLIPKRFKLAIPQVRINRIYYELQSLNVEKFVNCCAVMFRVFVELSVDDFAHRKGISLKVFIKKTKPLPSSGLHQQNRDMTLRKKLMIIADYLESHNVCTKAELQGIRALITNRYHVLSVDSFNAYVHNKDYNPTPADLKNTWDNLQVFIERLWTA